MVVEGKGSYGIVLSSPRISLQEETYDEIKELSQVSKLLYYVEENKYIPDTKSINLIYNNVIKLIGEYPHVFNMEYFMLPIKAGCVDKDKFILEFNDTKLAYGTNWLSGSINNLEIISQLIAHSNKLYQVIYEKGTPLVYNNFNVFLDKIYNVYTGLELCHQNGFYFDDLKYSNLIEHDDKIKMIDFEEPINLNLPTKTYIKKILDSKFNFVMYFPYDTLSNVLLYEYIGNINKIGNLKNNNYFGLLHLNIWEFKTHISYKIKAFNNLIDFWNKYLKSFTIEIEVYDLEFADLEKYNITNYDFEAHFMSCEAEKILNENKVKINLDVKIFTESIKMTYISYLIEQSINKYGSRYNYDITGITNLINKIFISSKKFINLTKSSHKEIISYLLSNTSIYSFGFMFLDWFTLYKNKNTNNNTIEMLEKIITIVANCCLNYIVIDNKIFLLDRNFLNIKKIIKF